MKIASPEHPEKSRKPGSRVTCGLWEFSVPVRLVARDIKVN